MARQSEVSMADNNGFGTRLRGAREQMGMSLDEAGRRLRIEPQVLDAIEKADFANMPPKYMTRSMVSSYAQLVGLNSTTLTRDFLDAEFQYQLSKSNGIYDNSQSSNQISTRQASPAAQAQAQAAYSTGSIPRPTFQDGELPRTTSSVSYRQSSAARTSGVDSAWQPGGYTRVSSQPASDTGRQRVSMNESNNAQKKGVRRNPDGTIRKPHFDALKEPGVDYGDVPSTAVAVNPQPRRDYSRLIMIVGCVLAVVLIVVLIKVIFVPEQGSSIDPNEAISGLTDPEQTGISTSTGSTTARTPIKPTACYFSIQVADQEGVWLGIFTTSDSFYDGNGELLWSDKTRVYDYYVEPGTRLQYDVTEKMFIRTNVPAAVTLTVNGERVEWQKSGWVYYYIVDFPAYLEAWEAENKTE